MCQVIAVRHVEDCFDGDFIKEFELNQPLDEAIMRRLADKGKLQYFPDFPRPYFRIDRQGACTIQGVIGKKTFRVTFSRSGPKDMENMLRTQVQKGEPDGC
ncbi:MAG: hypothetical protein JW818_02615 [Pirellulales bacterium]|nr:hypothetical protein [Pirellulales bacterium]